MTNIHLIAHLGDGCVIAGTLVQFVQTVPMPPVACSIPKVPGASCRVSVLTGTLGTLDFDARRVVKIGTDKDHMVDIKAPGDVVIYLTSLLNLEQASPEQCPLPKCNPIASRQDSVLMARQEAHTL